MDGSGDTTGIWRIRGEMKGGQPVDGIKVIVRLVKENRQALAGGIVLLVWILFAVLVPLFWPWSYSEQNVKLCNQAVSMEHLFGTDKFGRDIFARVWYGAGISLLVGTVSALINGSVGVLYGSLAGYAGRYADIVLMRIADLITSIPSMLYVILITLAAGAGVGSIILGLCVAGWVGQRRGLCAQRSGGLERDRFCSCCPNGRNPPHQDPVAASASKRAAGPIVVNMIFLIPQAVFTEAFLSFLGVGLKPPAASLGTIIQEARSQMILYPNQMICPLIVLCVMLLALNTIGTAAEEQMRGGKNE